MDIQASEVLRNDSPYTLGTHNSDLRKLRVNDIWGYFKTQGILFWLINFYLLLEYVRPLTLYPSLDVLPLTKIIIITTLAIFLLDGTTTWVTNVSNKLLLLFFAVILLSSFFAISPKIAFQKIPEFIVWILIYFLIINIVNTERRFLIFILAFLLYSFKMAQFSFWGWANQGFGFSADGTGGGPGWFQNSGEFGIQMCIFLPLAFFFFIALKEYWPWWKKGVFIFFPLFALSGTISSSSRGAIVGASAVLLWMLFKSRYKFKTLATLILVGMFMFAFVPAEQKGRFETAGDEQDRTSQSRMERWAKGREMVARYPVFGVGYANWGVADRVMFGGNGALSHNVFVECMSELGYTGLAVFLLMILFTFISNHKTRKLALQLGVENRFFYYMAHGLDAALIGFLVSGFFVTVLYYPYFWVNLAMTVSLNTIARKCPSN